MAAGAGVRVMDVLAVGAVAILVSGAAIAASPKGEPAAAPPSASAPTSTGYERTGLEQQLAIDEDVEAPAPVARDGFAATEAVTPARVADGGTNYDWAELVLFYGGWPITEASVTTIVRWMRQENYVDSWWLRNNPLNNGWGTSTGDFWGGYASLDDAARNAADAIHTLPGYAGIREAFAAAVSSEESAYAIWHSTWAAGHYAYGAHWSTAPVEAVQAPAEAWGF